MTFCNTTRVMIQEIKDTMATLTQLCASWDKTMRGNPRDHREHRASGELWGSPGFPSWAVSQSNGGAPWGLFRMSPQCNASSATEQ